MVKKINIGFDIDNVILDFTEAFLRTASDKFGILKKAKYSDVTRYAFYECLDISRDKCYEIVDYVLNNHFECNVRPIKGSVEVLTTLSKDMDLVFVTARKNIFKQQTKKLIYHTLPDVDKSKITIIHESGSKKYKILNDLNIEGFIDDRSKNVRILNENNIDAYLFNRPWNAKTRSDDSFERIDTWKEIYNLVKEIQNGKTD